MQRKKNTSDQASMHTEGRQNMEVSKEERGWQVGLETLKEL